MNSSLLALACLAGYLCGSIPFGLILTRLAGLGDIRKVGSGNIGATNVLRMGNKTLAAAVLILDGLKGFLPAFLMLITTHRPMFERPATADNPFTTFGGPLVPDYSIVFAVGFFAILGHVFPVWLKFKGGKGVSTAIGTFFGIHMLLGLSVITVWLVVFIFSRISSLAALSAFFLCSLVIASITFADSQVGVHLCLYSLAVTALIFWRHKDNIRRLMKGEEPKFGKK